MKVPFLDLKQLHRPLKQAILDEVSEMFDNNAFVQGPYTNRFEADWATFTGTRHAVGLQSGTAALSAALAALGVGPGDEVVTAANTFAATAGAIHFAGARAVLVDVDDQSYNLDTAALSRAITPRTKALIPVHLYGQMADMDEIMAIANHHGLAVIEDAAQAHGATYKGRNAGTIGTIGCFSFYPGKNLGAAGEAGAAITEGERLARAMMRFRNHGGIEKYEHSEPGLNLRMEGFQGIVLTHKLPHLQAWNEQRREIAAKYSRELVGLPLVTPKELAGNRHVYHLYVVQTDARDGLLAHLQAAGIGCGIHYPQPIHLLPAYAGLGYTRGAFPICETLAQRILSLPIYPGMTAAQTDRVIEQVRLFFRKQE